MQIEIICRDNNSRKPQIEKAVSVLNAFQNYFCFHLSYNDLFDDVVENGLKKESINWDWFYEKHLSETGYRVYITEKKLDDNWFSHESNSFSLLSTADWELQFAPPSLCSFVIYQIAQAAINFHADLTEQMSIRLVHDRSQGCMFDFCMLKTDIKLGMVAGTICPSCKSALIRYGAEEEAIDAIEKILNYVRSESIGKPILFNENSAFVVMRFSTNDENDNSFKYGIKEALKEMGIACNRADNSVVSGPILKKIYKSIKRNRFIIAKVDNENLNVYFELGLAMGLDKNVLLISEKELVLKLPSDLKNWECLTYTKGNYEELKRKIMKYFHDNFHC